jgi:3-hydroxyisobutyrate dehydrogenase-like beta-hydroxyacid dehydrogenase
MAPTIGLLHPGEMGAAVGAVLREQGDRVVWASDGRSSETRSRAEEAGLEDAGSVEELVRESDVILSICPPHAALELAGAVAGFRGVFVDANAIAPATAREVAAVIAAGGGESVDGGIVGPPPRAPGTTRLYLSGAEAESVAGLFGGSVVDARVLYGEVGTASALKMAYAAWTKGTAALLLAVGELARVEGVETALHEEWRASLPELPERSIRAARSAQSKGWRWVGEMEEIAATFDAAGLPEGFHRAAAEVFRTSAGSRAR